jgi:hypothetical protein
MIEWMSRKERLEGLGGAIINGVSKRMQLTELIDGFLTRLLTKILAKPLAEPLAKACCKLLIEPRHNPRLEAAHNWLPNVRKEVYVSV